MWSFHFVVSTQPTPLHPSPILLANNNPSLSHPPAIYVISLNPSRLMFLPCTVMNSICEMAHDSGWLIETVCIIQTIKWRRIYVDLSATCRSPSPNKTPPSSQVRLARCGINYIPSAMGYAGNYERVTLRSGDCMYGTSIIQVPTELVTVTTRPRQPETSTTPSTTST